MTKKKNVVDEIICLGLDLGFGKTKVVSGDTKLTFPSIAGIAPDVRFGGDSLARRFPNEQIEHDGYSWWVGNITLDNLKPYEKQRLRGRTGNEDEQGMNFRALLMKSALARLFPDMTNGDVIHFRIVTGLPVNHMGQAAALKKALIGTHPIHTDQTNFVANVVDVAVVPEPRGTMLAFMLRPDGSLNDEYTADTTVVFNGGAVTNDVQYDKNGEFVDSKSASSPTGHHIAIERIERMLESRYGDTPDTEVVESVLHNGAARINNKVETFYDEVETALKPVRAGALQLLSDTIGTGMSVDRIIVSGGFALSSYGIIAEQYPQSVKSDNPLFDTAQGYYNYSMFKSW